MLENSLLKDKEFVDQMVKRGRYSDDYRTREFTNMVYNIELSCRGSSLYLCRDYKKFGRICSSDWDQIVKCHHGHSQEITFHGGVTFNLCQYDWHRDRRIYDIKFNI